MKQYAKPSLKALGPLRLVTKFSGREWHPKHPHPLHPLHPRHKD